MILYRIYLAIFMLLFMFPLSSFDASAQFGIGATVCDTAWYCTEFDQGSCGSRTCIDMNECGVDRNKPSEYVACPPPTQPSSGGSPGGGGGSFADIQESTQTQPVDFHVEPTIFRPQITADENGIYNINLKSISDAEYKVYAVVPSNYSLPEKFLSISPEIVNISADYTQKFSIKINSDGVAPGIYIIPIYFENDDKVKKSTLIVTVEPKKYLLDFVIDMSKENKIVEGQSTLETKLRFPDNYDNKRLTFQYDVLTMDGDPIYTLVQDHIIQEQKIVERLLSLPNNIKPGYYVLSVTVTDNTEARSKYEVFVVVPTRDNTQEAQQPTIISTPAIFDNVWIYFAIIGLFIVVIGFNFFMTSRKQKNISKQIKDDKQKVTTNKIINSDKTIQKQPLPVTEQQPIPEEFKKEPGNKNITRTPLNLSAIYSKEGEEFYTKDDVKLKSLQDLLNYLNKISKESFEHHVSNEKNDFYNWILNALMLPNLANRIKSASTVEKMISELENFKKRK